MTEQEMLNKLLEYSTSTVANVVATYLGNPQCLGLYDAWHGSWYTDQTVHCAFYEMGRRIGYAATVVRSVSKAGLASLSWMDVVDMLARAKKPVILVCQQSYPSAEILNRAGLFGGQSTALLKVCGVVGVVTDGPSRDVDELRPLGLQYVMSGVTPAHGEFSFEAVGVPVSVAGMDAVPGEVVHMDEHGACKFPADRLTDVCAMVEQFSQAELRQARILLEARSVDKIKRAWSSRA